uniref:uncharacterized protein LOC113475133 n=1 Tax=Ciona intestinalis TaxID=7719 RepID=UPI000EF49C13|nr:uncharacterized protein LOC113475133 [Ciona intestinalis]|eukprot:XP_026694591.1 uncharacterized protein LOC113475133 [Ciona intestinalis]
MLNTMYSRNNHSKFCHVIRQINTLKGFITLTVEMLDIGSVLGCGNAKSVPKILGEISPSIESEAPRYIETCTQVSPIKVVHAKHEHVCHFERKELELHPMPKQMKDVQ